VYTSLPLAHTFPINLPLDINSASIVETFKTAVAFVGICSRRKFTFDVELLEIRLKGIVNSEYKFQDN